VSHSLQNDTPVAMRAANARNRKLETELHCTITGESDAAVRIHSGQRERNISKIMILDVEELPGTSSSAVSQRY